MNWLKRLCRHFVDSEVDEQINRIEHEQDLAALKTQHRSELDVIYADLLETRRVLTEEKPA